LVIKLFLFAARAIYTAWVAVKVINRPSHTTVADWVAFISSSPRIGPATRAGGV
jgi:hypothetical protein